MATIEERVKKIVSEQLGLLPSDVKTQSNFENDLGADSLDAVEVVMALEDEFEIEISDDDAEKMQTVQQAIDFVSKYVKA